MKFYIIGLDIREAQGYAMRMKPEHQGHHVRILSVQQVQHGGLRGLSGDDVEISVLPRAWGHQAAVSLGLELEALEALGVRVVTVKEVK